MKKILYVTTVSSTINAFLIPHIKMLIDECCQVDIACSIDKAIDDELIKYGVNIYKIPFSRKPVSRNNIKAYKEINLLVKKNKYDIVHVHTPVASFVTRMSLRKENVEMIYTAHGFHFYKGAPLINWIVYYNLEKLAARWTDKLVTINSEDLAHANKFKLRSGKKPIKVNGIGIDLSHYKVNEFNKESFKENLGLFKNDFIITVVAALRKEKNHIQLIDAIQEIRNEYRNIKLLLVGDGILTEKINNYLDENDLRDSIKMLGFRTDINEIMGISDVIALTSLREGLPRNLMEAMAIGKPIICTDIRGNNELVKDGINGILVPVNDLEKTKEAIKKVYKNKKVITEYGERSIENVSKYDIKNVLKEMKKVTFQ